MCWAAALVCAGLIAVVGFRWWALGWCVAGKPGAEITRPWGCGLSVGWPERPDRWSPWILRWAGVGAQLSRWVELLRWVLIRGRLGRGRPALECLPASARLAEMRLLAEVDRWVVVAALRPPPGRLVEGGGGVVSARRGDCGRSRGDDSFHGTQWRVRSGGLGAGGAAGGYPGRGRGWAGEPVVGTCWRRGRGTACG